MTKLRLKLFVFHTSEGEKQLHTHFYEGSVWLTLEQISELFCTTPKEVSKYLKKIYQHKGLQEDIVSKSFLVPNYEYFFQSGKEQKYYNIDAILAIGYQLEAVVATDFRKWSVKKFQDFQVKASFDGVNNLYLIQLGANFIFAWAFAFSMSLFIDINLQQTLGITALLLLMTVYNIMFEALRYQKENGYKKSLF